MEAPISKGVIKDWEDAKSKKDDLERLIVNRIDYMVGLIFKEFGEKLITWWFSNAQEGDLGDFYYDEPGFIVNWDSEDVKNDMIIIDKNGSEWKFDDSIPTRWLFENFEKELKNGKKKYQEQQSAKLIKTLSDKEAKKKLIKSAKLKLTKEELAAIQNSK